MVAQKLDTAQPNSPAGDLSFSELLFDVLGFSDDEDENVSICHYKAEANGNDWHASIRKASDGPPAVAALPVEADIYFGVNPVPRKIRGRGKNGDVTRLSALIADLDFSEGKCGDIDTANAIIDDLSKILGTPPSAITHSGGGLHPYWPVDSEEPDPDLEPPDLDDENALDPAALLKRWRRLVNAVAKKHGAQVDPVFDLARVLRVPGTFNNKSATNSHGPIQVVCHRGSGVALSLLEIHRRFDDFGIHHIPDYRDPDAKRGEFNYAKILSDPDTWEFADETCFYAAAMIDGWADDANPDGLEMGRARHHWFLSQTVRLNCARRLECVTEADYEHAKDAVTKTLIHLCSTRQPVRKVPPGEIADGFKYGMDKAATKTEDEAREELGGHVHDNPKDKDKQPIFREYGPTEWAKPVEPLAFVIPGVLCLDTFGANAGPKKSLKTHDNGALALSIATGTSLYRNDVYFPVFKPGKGLYLIGEGGEKPVIRMVQRICRAYGIKLEDVMNDPAFPLVLEFGAAPLDSDNLRDEITRLLDRHQPDFVIMESFYNFHPKEVNPANLYERGQVIDAYHKLVRAGGENVISLLTDHYRSTNTGKSLDLDNISMAGQAENADSWITRYPVKTNVRDGQFSLRVGFGSRQWGGTEWKIDWHLGQFDHEKGCHIGEISWDVAPAYEAPADEKDNTDKIRFNNDDEVMAHIRSQVLKNPRMTKSEHIALTYGEVLITKVRLGELWAKARENGMIYQQKVERNEDDPKNPGQTRSVTREVWLPGQGEATATEQRDTWGVTT